MRFDFLLNVMQGAIRLFCPRKAKTIPSTMWDVIGDVLPAGWEMVQELRAADGLKGNDKRQAVVRAVRDLLDEGLDDIPGWCSLTEAARDRIIDGMTESIYQIVRVVEEARDPDEAVDEIVVALESGDHRPLMARGLARGVRRRRLVTVG